MPNKDPKKKKKAAANEPAAKKAAAKKEPRMPNKDPKKKAANEPAKKKAKTEEQGVSAEPFEGVSAERYRSVVCGMSREQRYRDRCGELAMPKNDHLNIGLCQGSARCLKRCKNSYCHYRGCLCGPDAVWE
jgi:hypothetical protein